MVRSFLKLKCSKKNDAPIFANHFERCQWQKTNEPNLWYILYRWFLALFLLAVLIWSIFDVKRHPSNDQGYSKWPVYLTNWAFTFATVQAMVGLWIVQSAWINRNKVESTEERKMSLLHKIYWIINIVGIDMAFTISIIYWGLVHDTKIHKLDTINVLMHGGNSILMFFEICMVSHPCRFLFGLLSVSLGLTYSIFSYIYYACGGTDRQGNHYIYVPLDWKKPEKATVVCILSMVTTFAVHCAVYGLFQLKLRLTKPKEPEPIPAITQQEKLTLLEIA